MKKGLQVYLTDDELLDLYRIMIDDDAEAALLFLKKNFRAKVRDLLEGG